MTKNYYAVTVKCGHVGQGKFIIKTFAVIAESGKDAARLGREIPRVKRHNKHCILDVKKISYEAFVSLNKENHKDPYLHCKNKQEQNILCPNITEDVHELYPKKTISKQERNDRIERQARINKIVEDELEMDIRLYRMGIQVA